MPHTFLPQRALINAGFLHERASLTAAPLSLLLPWHSRLNRVVRSLLPPVFSAALPVLHESTTSARLARWCWWWCYAPLPLSTHTSTVSTLLVKPSRVVLSLYLLFMLTMFKLAFDEASCPELSAFQLYYVNAHSAVDLLEEEREEKQCIWVI